MPWTLFLTRMPRLGRIRGSSFPNALFDRLLWQSGRLESSQNTNQVHAPSCLNPVAIPCRISVSLRGGRALSLIEGLYTGPREQTALSGVACGGRARAAGSGSGLGHDGVCKSAGIARASRRLTEPVVSGRIGCESGGRGFRSSVDASGLALLAGGASSLWRVVCYFRADRRRLRGPGRSWSAKRNNACCDGWPDAPVGNGANRRGFAALRSVWDLPPIVEEGA